MLALGECCENWPRIGLECMAAGVPIIADARGGWLEMLEHNKTGILADSPEEASAALVLLATDETFRLWVADQARGSLGTLADPKVLGEQWRNLFSALGC
jgi:glycosyltransferase involved in cell wall biosynthesis